MAKNYEESWFDMDGDKISEIKNKINTIVIRLQAINCKVVLVPVTTMSLTKWNHHRKQIGKTSHLKFLNQYDSMQIKLNETIAEINRFIIELNTKNKMVTPLLHSFVHKVSGSKTRYLYSSLVDGVHQSEDLAQKWIKHMNKTMSQNEKNLKASSTFCN